MFPIVTSNPSTDSVKDSSFSFSLGLCSFSRFESGVDANA